MWKGKFFMASQNTQMCFSRWDPYPKTTEPIPQQVQGSSRRHPSADLLNLPGPVATHGSSILGFFFFFFLTSVLPLLYEIFSFFVVFKTFSSNRSKERAFWRRDAFSVTIFLKPYGLHFLQKEKEFSLLFLIAFSPKEKHKEKMQKHLFLLF